MSGAHRGGAGPVERFFVHLSARDWDALAAVLAPGVERVGPLGDLVVGREEYVAHLSAMVPSDYGNDVHRVMYGPDRRTAFARVTEHLVYPNSEYHLEEAYAFEVDEDGRIARIDVFWQSPPAGAAPS
jgi:SnoaL-like protein